MAITAKYMTSTLSDVEPGALVALPLGQGFDIGILLEKQNDVASVGILVSAEQQLRATAEPIRLDNVCIVYADGWEIEPIFDIEQPSDFNGSLRDKAGTLSVNGSRLVMRFRGGQGAHSWGGTYDLSTGKPVETLDRMSIPVTGWRLWHSAEDRKFGREPIFDSTQS